jgi:hypothetical protein
MSTDLVSNPCVDESGGRGPGQRLVRDLDQLPDEAFTRLQYLQVQVGCFNRCAFCSQQAGTVVWQLSSTGLRDLVSALVTVTTRRGLRLGAGRHTHRPGVLFPYLDNDIASYPHFGQLVEHCSTDLGVRLRISTVGYSRHNLALAGAHVSIVADHSDVVAGIRFSLTPYAVGFRTNRAEYLADLAAALRTWRPYVDRVGASADRAAIELRFAPLVHAVDAPMLDTTIDGHHVISVPPHLLVSNRPLGGRPAPTTISAVVGREAFFTDPGQPYRLITSDQIIGDNGADATARLILAGHIPGTARVRTVSVHTWVNADGPYYAIEPAFAADGTFRGMHLYPRTERRRRSGYTDATRFFLNALLEHKQALGIARRRPHPSAADADVDAVLSRIAETAEALGDVDRRAAAHIQRHVLPMVRAVAETLRQAGYPPSAFFDPNFVIDTGQIVNQGNALSLFRGLAATMDEPMTPREERGYGAVSLSSQRGTVWRIALTPSGAGLQAHIGGKNTAQPRPALIVEELDPQHLRPVDRATGRPLRRILIDGVDTEILSLTDAAQHHAFPGAAA